MARASDTERFLAAWMRLRQMVQAANFNRFQQAGLSATQFMTLNIIPHEGITLTDLSRTLNLSISTMHQTVSSLQARALIERECDSEDARKVRIVVTKQGHELQSTSKSGFSHYIETLFKSMSRETRSGLLQGLEAMVAQSPPGEDGTTLRGGRARKPARNSQRSRPQ